MSVHKPAVRKALSIRDQLQQAAKDGGDRLKDEPNLMSAGHQYGKHLAMMEMYYSEAAQNVAGDEKLSNYYRGHASAYRDAWSVFEELLQFDVLSELRADEMMKKVFVAANLR